MRKGFRSVLVNGPRMGLFGILLGLLVGLPSSQALSTDVDVKKMMGENFAHIQTILVDLIRSDYANVSHDVGVIEEHAVHLTEIRPGTAAKGEKLYLSLAYSLGTHAKNLKMITEALAKRDKASSQLGLLDVDYLRNSAAAHFGELVATCVACHNQFRRVKK